MLKNFSKNTLHQSHFSFILPEIRRKWCSYFSQLSSKMHQWQGHEFNPNYHYIFKINYFFYK